MFGLSNSCLCFWSWSRAALKSSKHSRSWRIKVCGTFQEFLSEFRYLVSSTLFGIGSIDNELHETFLG